MKSFTLFALLAVMVVCMLGQQQQANASFWRDVKHDAHDVGHAAERVADDTAHVAKKGVDDIDHDAGPAIHTVDKVANEIEPVAKVVVTGIQIGDTVDSLV